MLQGFHNADIGVVELNVFADQGNGNFRGGVLKVIDHLRPVFEIWFGTVKTETLTDCLCQMFLFHGKRRFVQVFYVQVLQYAGRRYVAE